MEFMQKVKVGIVAVVSILMLIFIFQNTVQVEGMILFIPFSLPLFALLLTSLGVGFGLGWLSSAMLRRKKAKEAQL